MAVGRLAVKLGNELGVTASKAQRFVDEAGEAPAMNLLDDVQTRGSRTLPDGWWRPVAAGGGITGAAGGTALAWRQQDVWKAREAANAADSYQETVRQIIESDLPGEVKLAMAQGAQQTAENSGGGGGGGGDDDGGLLGQDTQTTLVLLIVAVIVLVYGLNTVGGD